MNVQEINLIDIFIVLGSILGSIKGSIIVSKQLNCSVLFDFILGSFIGISTGYHFENQYTIFITGLISLVAGASGSLIIKVILEMIPEVIKKYVEQRLGVK